MDIAMPAIYDLYNMEQVDNLLNIYFREKYRKTRLEKINFHITS